MQRNTQSARHRTAKKPVLQKRLLHALLVVGIVLLLLIPSYIAVAHYRYTKNNPMNLADTDYFAATLTRGDTVLTAALSEQDESEPDLLRLLRALVTDTVGGADQPTYEADYSVSLENRLGRDVFSVWFDKDAVTFYITDESGTCRRTSDTAALEFLNSAYAFALYPQATPPVLTTAATDEVIPSTLSWSYQLQNKQFTERIGVETTDRILTYPIANDIDLYFSIEPSSYNVTITRNGVSSTFVGGEKISLSQLARDDLLDVVITARYEPSSDHAYYGEATYHFTLRVSEAAQIEMSTTSVPVGSYFLLTCKNVKNTQNLELSVPNLTPILFELDDTLFVAIPAGEVGEHTLTVRYGTVTGTFTLTTTETSDQHHSFAQGSLRGSIAGIFGAELQERIAQFGAESASANRDFTPPRYSFPNISAERQFAFGDTVSVTDSDFSAKAYFEYYQTDGSVKPSAPGRVIHVGYGDAVLGNFVIVDHGCGLYTWYCGLDQIRVHEGNVVGITDILGTAGIGGFGVGAESGFVYITTLGKSAIDPDVLREGSFLSPAR